MSQNRQTQFKNLAANAARFLKCVWPFWDIMHERFKGDKTLGKFHEFYSNENLPKIIFYRIPPWLVKSKIHQ